MLVVVATGPCMMNERGIEGVINPLLFPTKAPGRADLRSSRPAVHLPLCNPRKNNDIWGVQPLAGFHGAEVQRPAGSKVKEKQVVGLRKKIFKKPVLFF